MIGSVGHRYRGPSEADAFERSAAWRLDQHAAQTAPAGPPVATTPAPEAAEPAPIAPFWAVGAPPGQPPFADLHLPDVRPPLEPPPPPVVATAAPGVQKASAEEIAAHELMLADPQSRALALHGTSTPLGGNPVADALVSRYGEDLAGRLYQHAAGLANVRSDCVNALQAAAEQSGPGRPFSMPPPATAWDANVGLWDFDPVAFTEHYRQGDTPSQRLYVAFEAESGLGLSPPQRQVTIGEQGEATISWSPALLMTTDVVFVPVDPMAPPRLHDDSAVWFDPTRGFVTTRENSYVEPDSFLDKLMPVVFVAAATWATSGVFGLQAGGAAAAGSSLGTAAAVGAIGSAWGGLVYTGRVDFKDMLRGAFTAAVTSGVVNGLGLNSAGLQTAGAPTYAAQALAITGRATLQGALQEVLGGRFRDGFSAGLVSGLAQEVMLELMARIEAMPTLNAYESAVMQTMARATGSAIVALANPADPGFAFAQDFLGRLLTDELQDAAAPIPKAGPAVNFTLFDDDGNLTPGVVDPALPPLEQALQLAEQLQQQGFGADEAAELALEAIPLASDVSLLSPPNSVWAHWTEAERQDRIDDVERRVQADLDAQQARAESLLGADDLAVDTGGARGPRPPVRPVLDGRFDNALNAAGDVAGLLDPIRALQSDLGRLGGLQAESAIDSMRGALRAAGMANVPEGYVQAWDANGNIGRDYGATAQRLETAYRGFVEDRRLTEGWGSGWRDLRIGKSQMTVPQFEDRVLSLQQQASDEAYRRGTRAIAEGNLPLRSASYALTFGTYIDEQVRLDLRAFGRAEGLPDSASSNLFAVNRQLRGAGMIGVPDLKLGANTLSDVSLSQKDGLTEQLRRWQVIRPNDTLVVRPGQLGGSYVVPRSTIQPLVQPRRGG